MLLDMSFAESPIGAWVRFGDRCWRSRPRIARRAKALRRRNHCRHRLRRGHVTTIVRALHARYGYLARSGEWLERFQL